MKLAILAALAAGASAADCPVIYQTPYDDPDCTVELGGGDETYQPPAAD